MPLIRSLRPVQWVKNLVVFAGLIFARHFDQPDDILRSVGVFGVFCALASAIYLFNDTRDRDSDRSHPQKKTRPIASGELSIGLAAATSVVLFAVGLTAACRSVSMCLSRWRSTSCLTSPTRWGLSISP